MTQSNGGKCSGIYLLFLLSPSDISVRTTNSNDLGSEYYTLSSFFLLLLFLF